jgi:hypothetical protein
VTRQLIISLAAFAAHAIAAQSPSRTFDRAAWQADYALLKVELERSYSHLAWFGSPEGGVDLPSLDRTTREALGRAKSDSEAVAAIRRFIFGFHDGHLTMRPAQSPAGLPTSEPAAVNRADDARTACAAFGFTPVTRVSFSLPFESLPGFTLVSDGLSEAFRAGVITQFGLRIGVVRIPRFRPTEFPSVCERAWESLRAANREPTRSAINGVASEEWLRVLAERLKGLEARGANVVVVDIGGNGGGNDLGDWAVRLFSRDSVSSAPMLMSASKVAIPYFDEQLGDLRNALDSTTGQTAPVRAALSTAVTEFENWKQTATAPMCDMSWVWRETRRWQTSACTRLIPSGFASGARAYIAPGTLPTPAAHALYWASRADEFRGAWNGPTYVLTDSNTGSAAEMFAALIRDRDIAKVVGGHTYGSGCGFAVGGPPVLLSHAQLAVTIPNCVRLRADGTDEVAGIAPDIRVAAGPSESARSVAWRALQAIVADTATHSGARPRPPM